MGAVHEDRSPNRTDEQWPEAARYVLAIFLSGAALWMLLTLRKVISPPSNTDLCGDETAMCCRGGAHRQLRAASVEHCGQLRGASGPSGGRVRVGRRRAGRTRLRRRGRALPTSAGPAQA